ncbi:hypothetical protein CHKEEEPN_0127 [Methylorubrum podarium]|nr:hypothetical protein CHKEEEPN_0127 [Methylorubrum podarium]
MGHDEASAVRIACLDGHGAARRAGATAAHRAAGRLHEQHRGQSGHGHPARPRQLCRVDDRRFGGDDAELPDRRRADAEPDAGPDPGGDPGRPDGAILQHPERARAADLGLYHRGGRVLLRHAADEPHAHDLRGLDPRRPDRQHQRRLQRQRGRDDLRQRHRHPARRRGHLHRQHGPGQRLDRAAQAGVRTLPGGDPGHRPPRGPLQRLQRGDEQAGPVGPRHGGPRRAELPLELPGPGGLRHGGALGEGLHRHPGDDRRQWRAAALGAERRVLRRGRHLHAHDLRRRRVRAGHRHRAAPLPRLHRRQRADAAQPAHQRHQRLRGWRLPERPHQFRLSPDPWGRLPRAAALAGTADARVRTRQRPYPRRDALALRRDGRPDAVGGHRRDQHLRRALRRPGQPNRLDEPRQRRRLRRLPSLPADPGLSGGELRRGERGRVPHRVRRLRNRRRLRQRRPEQGRLHRAPDLRLPADRTEPAHERGGGPAPGAGAAADPLSLPLRRAAPRDPGDDGPALGLPAPGRQHL